MRVLDVTLQDFGAYAGSHSFRIADQGLVLIEGQNLDEPRMVSNGAGKSTLIDALDWCLFGEVPRKDAADSVIHDGAKTCEVVAALEDDSGAQARVVRARPARLEFWVGGQNLTTHDVAETQAVIDRWLGLDREVFHAAVLFAQTDQAHFADAKDAERMDILTKILPEMRLVDGLEEPAKALRAAKLSAVVAAESQCAMWSGRVAGIRAEDFTTRAQAWETEHAEAVTRSATELRELQAKALASQVPPAEVTAAEAYVASVAAAVAARLGSAPATSPELEQALAGHAEVIKGKTQAEAEQARLRREVEQLSRVQAGRCSSCGSQVTGEHLAQERLRLGGLLSASELAVVEWGRVTASRAAVVTACRAELDRLRAQYDAERGQLERQRRDADAALWALRNRQTAAERMAAQAQAGAEKHAVLAAQQNPWVGAIHEHRERLRAAETELAAEEARLTGLREELRYAEFWVTATGSRGLKSYILDARLHELTDAVNEWVRLLTGGTFWVRFESQKQAKTTKNVRNAPSVRVFKYLPDGRVVERAYRSFSGGEKRRISWAIDFGLSRLVARRATKHWDLLILDEVFSHVDRAGGQAIVEMLQALRRERSTIFVIEHDAEFRSAFEKVWTVQKRGGKSQLLTSGANDASKETKVEAEIQKAVVVGQAQPQKPQIRRGILRKGVIRK
jgi:DNA repair exonuclease SbcCD ATPase subunit